MKGYLINKNINWFYISSIFLIVFGVLGITACPILAYYVSSNLQEVENSFGYTQNQLVDLNWGVEESEARARFWMIKYVVYGLFIYVGLIHLTFALKGVTLRNLDKTEHIAS
jgi:hypothetical protein